MEYKVKNKFKDVRKFRDNYLGKDILVGPGKSVITKRPPKKSKIWSVEKLEEKKSLAFPKQKLNNKEVNKDDSSSNR